ncbi:MAG TPA: Mur ligase family protein [Gaiellaceae bacterium]|nr:Mur ligase family protein [Gaiellaceae bacterium]
MPSPASAWLESLSPWPAEFGLGRMRALLARLGDPQHGFPAVHVVGTNGKSTTTRMTAALLRAEGLRVGAYTSPHIAGWHERLDTDPQSFERALERVRPAAEELGATQFEVLTAAALAEFAAREVDAAVVEAGLGGRLDATNVLAAKVVVLTNVALDHTDVLGSTREEIAAEKLAVVADGATVVLGEPEWEGLARERGAGLVLAPGRSNLALATAAAAQFLGRPVDPHAAEGVALPGRLEHRAADPDEIWDGAHNLAGVGYLLERLPRGPYVITLSILGDKDVDGMLRALTALGDTVIATTSTNARALPEKELAARAEPYFRHVEAIADPVAARERARRIAGRDGRVLVTGSLYLLAELSRTFDGGETIS